MSVILGIDIGGSTTKIVGLRRDGSTIAMYRVQAQDPISSLYGALGNFLFTNGLARALYKLGRATRRQANLLYIPLDALCSCFIFWLVDALMDSVEATGLSILALALIFALLSQPIGRGRGPDGGEGGAQRASS